MRFRYSILFFLSASVFSICASAQTIGTPPAGTLQGDTLSLKDGTVLHGSIREMTPGQAVTIVLPGGMVRTVEWSAVDSVNIDRAKPSGAPPVANPTSTLLHLEGADDVVVQTLDARGTQTSWVTVCKGSCDQPLDTNRTYRVDGPGLRASKEFQLQPSHTSYRVNRASTGAWAAGLTLLILGGSAVVTGLSFLLVGAEFNGLGNCINCQDFMIGGGVAMGLGVASLISGIILMKVNSHSAVTPTDAAPMPARVAAWRDVTPVWTARAPMIGGPIFAGTF